MVLYWISWRPARKIQRHLANLLARQPKTSYYAKTSCNVTIDFELSNVSEEITKKILHSLDTSKASGIDQIMAKFLKEGVEVLTFLLRSITNSFEKYNKFINKTTNLPREVFCH